MSKNVNPKVKITNDTRNENNFGRSETLELERVIRNNSYHISHIRKHKHSLFNHTVLKPINGEKLSNHRRKQVMHHARCRTVARRYN